MKNKTLKFAFLYSLIVMALMACDDNDEYYYVGPGNSWISYGNLEKIDNGTPSKFAIRRDDGNRLIVTEGVPLNFREATEDLRVYVNYSILGSERDENGLDGKMNYYIRLYALDDVLTKSPVKQSFIDENETVRQDSIGNDPINVKEVWFGGRYLNLEFKIPVKEESKTKHMINLVQEDVVNHNDTIYLTLRHNAFGEKPNDGDTHEKYFWNRGRVSFDLTSILPNGQTSVPVKLIWNEYGKNISEIITREDSGVYTLLNAQNENHGRALNYSAKLENEELPECTIE